MKKHTILLFILLVSSNIIFSQVVQDSLSVNYIYAPNYYNDSFSAEESWEIHKAAYIKQLKAKGLTDDEIKKSMVTYEKDKEEFITRVKEQQRLAEIQRKKAAEQRKLADVQRVKAEEQRKLADIQRKKAEEQRLKAEAQRKQADILRKQADEQRAKDETQRKNAVALRKQADIQRAKADEQRKLADIEREKAEKQRKLADIQRAKADEQRKKADAWRKNFKNILTKNVTLSNPSNSNAPIKFNVTSKTTLRIGIRASINSGSTLIEIYNPNGVREGELLLEHKYKSASGKDNDFLKYTSGALDKTISGAEAGEWQIKISPKKSEGTVALSVAQYINPTVDE